MASRQARKVTMTEMAKIINSPGKRIIYRQTCNWVGHKWSRPKRLQKDGRWKTIMDSMKLIQNYHNAMLIWTIWNKVDALKTDNKMRWSSQMYKVTHIGDYAYYYLVCRYNATAKSIHGIF